MSRVDLDQIQAQLKVAIQSHQKLVANMQADPQNTSLQKQLHELQAEITSLSERQKSIVQLLRKELVSKQHINRQQTSITSSSISRVSPLPPPQTVPTNLSLKGNNNNNNHAYTSANTQQLQNNRSAVPQVAHTNNSTTNNTSVNHHNNKNLNITAPTQNAVVRHQSPQKQQQQFHAKLNNHLSPGLTNTLGRGSPPIRVPQYTAHKPSILQVRKDVNGTATNDEKAKRPPSIMRSQGAPTVPVAPMRKNSESSTDIQDAKASIEKKEISPDERQVSPTKLEYMASLDLVTPETLKEILNKRSERKRRSTANPQFSYGAFEPERKRRSYNYLARVQPQPQVKLQPGQKRRGRPPKKRPGLVIGQSPASSRAQSPAVGSSCDGSVGDDGDIHEDYCAVCHRSGELLMCDTCNLVYHLQCLEPPLTTIPQGLWSCPKCAAMAKNNSLPETLARVHAYIAARTAKEEEKRKLQKKSTDLHTEKAQLEAKAKQLTERMTANLMQHTELMKTSKNAQQSVDKLKQFIKFFQTP